VSERRRLAATLIVAAGATAALVRSFRHADAQRREAVGDLRQLNAEVEERERIVGELHDGVIQRVFAAGVQIQGVVPRLPGEVRPQIAEAMEELDASIVALRGAIGSLTHEA
jgi:signal transduction histidine kinase